MRLEEKYPGPAADARVQRSTLANQSKADATGQVALRLPFTFEISATPFLTPDGTIVQVPGFEDGRYMSTREMDQQTLDALVMAYIRGVYDMSDKPNPWSHSGYDKPAPARG